MIGLVLSSKKNVGREKKKLASIFFLKVEHKKRESLFTLIIK